MKLCRISQELIQEVLGMYVRQEAAGNPRPRQEDHAQHAPTKANRTPVSKQRIINKQIKLIYLCSSGCVHLAVCI